MRVLRIRTMLLAVALLPLAGLMVFATQDAATRWDLVQDAQLVEEDAALVGYFLSATDAIESELTAADAFVRVAALGLDLEFVEGQFGFDLVGALAPARVRFDTAMAALGSARRDSSQIEALGMVDRVLGGLDRMESFRADVDAGSADPEDIAGIRADLVDPLYAASAAQLDALGRRVEPLGEAGALDNVVQAAVRAVEVLELMRRETVDLTTFLVPFFWGSDNGESDLAVSAALLDQEVERLESLLDQSGLVAWRAMREVEAVGEFEATLDDALAGEIDPLAPGFDLTLAASAVNAGVIRLDLMGNFAADTNAQVIDEARDVGASARADLQLSVIVAGIVAVATLVGTVLISRSIVRPLDQLEARARRITQGELAEAVDRRRGPREIAIVDQAFDDLTAGLRVLETQSEALSVGDLSSSALQTTSPGRLGRSLQRSVRRLSEMTARLERQARYDMLTGLMNRTAGIEAIGRALARAERSGNDVGLLFVDLDGFKSINDVHGHAVGDEVLKQVADRLRDRCRSIDAVARLGGDEFIIVIDDLVEIAPAVRVASRVIEAMAEPFVVDDVTVRLSASIGVAWAPRGVSTESKLMIQADLALYRAKEQGKGRFDLFDDHLRQAVEHRAHVESSLRAAIDDARLELWYQPIVGLEGGEVWGMEALVRWRDATGELVMPNDFIPIAERSDLILDLDRFVLRSACEQLMRWDAYELSGGMSIAVNVSGRHLDTGKLVGDVESVLSATGMSPERLMVELTETRLIEDIDGVSLALAQLRELSIGVAVDDFGTGYSSVAHLRRLPVTRLKIDRSFVSASGNKTDRSILELLVWLGATLGLEVVAEGIEDAHQLQLTTDLGCTHGQGFLIGEPMLARDVGAWLIAHADTGVRWARRT